MSAWIVSRKHIDLLVGAAIGHGIIAPDEADATGRMLWAECLASVAYRYEGDTDGTRPGPHGFRDNDVQVYTFTPPGPECEDPFLVYKQAGCYDYQSCEHPAWETSEACALARKLCEAVEASVGKTGDQMRGDKRWDAAPWGINLTERTAGLVRPSGRTFSRWTLHLRAREQ